MEQINHIMIVGYDEQNINVVPYLSQLQIYDNFLLLIGVTKL